MRKKIHPISRKEQTKIILSLVAKGKSDIEIAEIMSLNRTWVFRVRKQNYKSVSNL